jgi:hypothetical protein
MLTIYKTTEQGLEQLDSMANGTWVKALTRREIQQLVDWGIKAITSIIRQPRRNAAWNGM